jgi:regulatory protein
VSGKPRSRSSRGRARHLKAVPAVTVIGAASSDGPDRARGADTTRGVDTEPGEAASAQADPESVARLICLRMLTAAPRTRAQLADALRRRGVPDDAAATVLARFADVGLIDDAMFASAWVETRHVGRGLGRRALAAELNQRGVDGADIRAAIDRLSPETELATARALVERRLASMAGQPAQVRARRLAGMLARRGYPSGLVYRVVREALELTGRETSADGDEDDEVFGEAGEFGPQEPD